MDKKLTDNEIVKALEICSTYEESCKNCPAFVKVDRSNCRKVLIGAKDIINRLQGENEEKDKRLKEVLKGIENIKEQAYKEFAERLKDMSEHFWEEKENFVSEEQIDNLLKELVGEDNESKN